MREEIEEALQDTRDARTAAATWDDDEAWADFEYARAQAGR